MSIHKIRRLSGVFIPVMVVLFAFSYFCKSLAIETPLFHDSITVPKPHAEPLVLANVSASCSILQSIEQAQLFDWKSAECLTDSKKIINITAMTSLVADRNVAAISITINAP
ncbi:MAG TPA: hypothetical protein VD884_09585 [Ohtaekwangia sp.]|nr:hypothetical protein [Ohtaekwangia sp.]